jgi:hypothetical protein
VGSKHGKTVRCGKTPVERWVIPPYKRQAAAMEEKLIDFLGKKEG